MNVCRDPTWQSGLQAKNQPLPLRPKAVLDAAAVSHPPTERNDADAAHSPARWLARGLIPFGAISDCGCLGFFMFGVHFYSVGERATLSVGTDKAAAAGV
jgi:hypothetical protein